MAVVFGFTSTVSDLLVCRRKVANSPTPSCVVGIFSAISSSCAPALTRNVGVPSGPGVVPSISRMRTPYRCSPRGETSNMPLYRDSALYIAALLAMFAILFGTRRIDATEHHHGLMLAIAVESLIKLIAFVAIGIYALNASGFAGAIATPIREFTEHGLPSGFVAQTLLAFVAMFCLPRQFQVGIIECEDPADVRQARRLFPAYLLLIIVFVLPIVAAGAPVALALGIDPDAYVLGLPLASGHNLLALFAYIGGFSAATGMAFGAGLRAEG